MYKTHACRAQLCNTRDSDDSLTSGHEIPIPMMHAAHGPDPDPDPDLF
jgi:hypothetical protein